MSCTPSKPQQYHNRCRCISLNCFWSIAARLFNKRFRRSCCIKYLAYKGLLKHLTWIHVMLISKLSVWLCISTSLPILTNTMDSEIKMCLWLPPPFFQQKIGVMQQLCCYFLFYLHVILSNFVGFIFQIHLNKPHN